MQDEYYLWTMYLQVFFLSIVRNLLNGLISNFFKQCQASVKNSISTHSVFETNLVGCWNSLRLTCRNGHSFCSSLSTVLLPNKSSDPAFIVKYKTLETIFCEKIISTYKWVLKWVLTAHNVFNLCFRISFEPRHLSVRIKMGSILQGSAFVDYL